MDAALHRRLDALLAVCAAILAFLVSSALFHHALYTLAGWLLLTVGIVKATDWYVRLSMLWETTDPYEPES